MISFAQNHEDIVLARLFTDQVAGFYVDVGAGHPTSDSVTRHFYNLGWRGLNVEPLRREYELLCDERPRDINVHAAVSDRGGTVVLYEAPPENRGASTLDPDIAERYGQDFVPVPVQALTLTDLLERFDIRTADFLKVDVEGHEAVIINSVDWTAFHPRVLVVEATSPNSNTPVHERWEPALLNAGYRCALFDGLNRFYADAADGEALKLLSVPANIFDDVEPWRWVSQLDGAATYITSLEERIAQLEGRLNVRGFVASLFRRS